MATHITNTDAFEGTALGLADALLQQLYRFVGPLVEQLDRLLDKRLVRTFVRTLISVVRHRHRQHGLLLSELGAFITSPEQAPAGTKRLSNLLRSPRWSHAIVESYLLGRADARLSELEAAGETALLLWDDSVIEKPESVAAEGLCAVRSSKALRLKRIKPGFYTPPGGPPVFVPGFQWISLMLCGLQAPPMLCRMHWWTTRGQHASDRRSEQGALFLEAFTRWKQRLVHVFDRGYAGEPWLGLLVGCGARFVMRWPKHFKLTDGSGQPRKAWQITRGRRTLAHRMLFDTRKQSLRKVGIYFTAVRHPGFPDPLYLVVSRPGKGRAPWYLLTNEPVMNERQAWHVIVVYARRWQIEMGFRYAKSELAMESPRLWFWHNRMKLLAIVTLVYAFLLELLRPEFEALRAKLLRKACPRTGKRSREVSAPLYRIRLALSHLWSAYFADLIPIQSSG